MGRGKEIMSITWNTGAAAMRFRHNLKLKKKFNQRLKPQAASSKRQAPSATKKPQLNSSMKLERL
jgi:hypothetical protein